MYNNKYNLIINLIKRHLLLLIMRLNLLKNIKVMLKVMKYILWVIKYLINENNQKLKMRLKKMLFIEVLNLRLIEMLFLIKKYKKVNLMFLMKDCQI